MDRREFLKNASIAMAASAVAHPLVGCGAVAPLAPYMQPVAIWFVNYAVSVSAGIVANTIYDYFTELPPQERTLADEVDNMMRSSGFSEFDGRKVYGKNGSSFFEVGHQDKFNGCAAFFNGVKISTFEEVPLVEGPTVMGLALIAEELKANKDNDPDTLAKALIPTIQEDHPNVQAFGRNYDKEFLAKTEFGRIKIDYENRGADKGVVFVNIYDKDGDEKYGRYYNIAFQG